MITTSNSPVKGSGIPNQLLGDRLHTMAISGLSRVSTWADGPRNLMKITWSRVQNRTGWSGEIEFADTLRARKLSREIVYLKLGHSEVFLWRNCRFCQFMQTSAAGI